MKTSHVNNRNIFIPDVSNDSWASTECYNFWVWWLSNFDNTDNRLFSHVRLLPAGMKSVTAADDRGKVYCRRSKVLVGQPICLPSTRGHFYLYSHWRAFCTRYTVPTHTCIHLQPFMHTVWCSSARAHI